MTFDGNSPITSFSVKHLHSHGNNTSYNVPSVKNHLIIDDLDLYSNHFFTVEAINNVGMSDPATVNWTAFSAGEV